MYNTLADVQLFNYQLQYEVGVTFLEALTVADSIEKCLQYPHCLEHGKLCFSTSKAKDVKEYNTGTSCLMYADTED
uniref:Uncharacterized protein n=1 Tax=Tetranychus urticae TaxID=32264 RepID=T1JTP4_TETUR